MDSFVQNRMVLTKMKMETLWLVLVWNFLTAHQIWRQINPHCQTINSTLDMVRFLCLHQYLVKIKNAGDRTSYYAVTPKGKIIGEKYGGIYIQRKAPDKRQVLHESRLFEINKALEKKGITGFKTYLKLSLSKNETQIPDAIYENSEGKLIAIEYDRTRRSNSRVIERLHFYRKAIEAGSINGLLYLVDSELLPVYEKIIARVSCAGIALKTYNSIVQENCYE